MSSVYVIYAGDKWLSASSLELIAVCDNTGTALTLIDKDAEDINEPLTAYHRISLLENLQTQGRDCNYIVEPVELNTLL